jgi:tripartite-type tricarboxylate transporter receptor subunit TctC
MSSRNPAPIVRRRSLLVGSVAATLAAPNLVEAQGTDWPKGPIKFVVPFPPGGSTDPVARLIQARLLETVGWQIVVENKPGAAGVIGATVVAKAAPDGQTWLVAFDSHILSPARLHQQPALQGFRSSERHAGRPGAARHRLPPRPSLQEFRRRDGRRPSAAGQAERRRALRQPAAAADHPPAEREWLRRQRDLLQGRRADGAGPVGRCHRHGAYHAGRPRAACPCGRLRALATTGDTRTPIPPETPTLHEQGVKGYPTYSWWGIYAAAGTPRPIVERMNAEIAKAVRSAEVAPKLAAQIGMEILATSPAAFADFQKVEQERWTRIIEENGIKAD